MGHEFTSLILALLQTGGHPPKVEASVIEEIRSIPGQFHFETFISLSCHNCPDVVQALNLMAVQNPGISHQMIDGALFQDEVTARQIMGVPTVFLNGEPFGQGRMTLEEIIGKIDTGALQREAEKVSARAPFDVLIVGGGPAGAAAAIYAARKGIRTGVVSERFGGQVLDTLAIENFISVKETDGPRLAAGLEEHVREYDVDIINLQRAEALLPGTGRRPDRSPSGQRRQAQEQDGDHRHRGTLARDECSRREAVSRPWRRLLPALRRAAVQGQAGGRDRWRQLRRRSGDRPRRRRRSGHPPRIRSHPACRRHACRRSSSVCPTCKVITQALSTEVTGDGQKVNGLLYTDRASGESRRIDLEGVFVQIGLLPNSEWLKGTIALSRHGEIEIDARTRNLAAGRLRRGRRDHGSLQADRHRHGRRLESRTQRLRPPDSQLGLLKALPPAASRALALGSGSSRFPDGLIARRTVR
jgi:alkyl hydroperoxide reductase subunit F